MSQTSTPPAAEPAIPKDPLVHKSYAFPTMVAMAVVVAATVLACVDEMVLRRPYKAIQGKYQETYSAYLAKVEAERRGFYDDVFTKLDDYTRLNDAAKGAAESVRPAAMEIQAQL